MLYSFFELGRVAPLVPWISLLRRVLGGLLYFLTTISCVVRKKLSDVDFGVGRTRRCPSCS